MIEIDNPIQKKFGDIFNLSNHVFLTNDLVMCQRSFKKGTVFCAREWKIINDEKFLDLIFDSWEGLIEEKIIEENFDIV